LKGQIEMNKPKKSETTLEHVQRAIGSVDPTAKLIAFYNQFPKEPPPGKVSANSLREWCLSRIKDLCGATSFSEAAKNASFNTVLAYAYLAFSKDSPQALPRINQYARVPAGIAKLEPDFFPELLKGLEAESKASPAFALKMKNAHQELAEVIARLNETPSKAAAASVHPAVDDGGGGVGGAIVAIVTFVLFYIAMGKKLS
jgi:hypothetical protein